MESNQNISSLLRELDRKLHEIMEIQRKQANQNAKAWLAAPIVVKHSMKL